MILAQRRRHLWVWIALAALVPAGLIAALLVRPPAPAAQRAPDGVPGAATESATERDP